MPDEEKQSKRDSGERDSAKAWLEFAAASVGALLATATIGFILYRGFTSVGASPELTVQLEGVAEQAGGYLAEILVRNSGESAAAEVVVSGELGPAPDVEQSEATFDYVPSRSERRGGLIFSEDPRAGDLRLRVQSQVYP